MSDWRGEDALADAAEKLLGRRHPVVALATVTPVGTSIAHRGAGLDADYEIGSISKGITGLLYRDAIQRGVLTERTTLGELFDFDPDVALSGVTVEALSRHTAGLPRLPSAAAPWRRTLRLWREGTNPYSETLEERLTQAGTITLRRPKPHYSNLGFELLGHGVAPASGATYAGLLERRINQPLQGTTFYAPANTGQLRPGALTGRSRAGRPREPWTGEAVAPAGGIRATITDLATLTEALLAGTVPGTSALDPVARFGSGAWIGAAWITVEHQGRTITWHNGGTGGFRSWLGLDRAAGCGAVILAATSTPVDRQGFRLLAGLT